MLSKPSRGAGTSLAAHQNDLAVVAADLGPVGDLAGEHLLELVNGQVLDLAVLVDDDAMPSRATIVPVTPVSSAFRRGKKDRCPESYR